MLSRKRKRNAESAFLNIHAGGPASCTMKQKTYNNKSIYADKVYLDPHIYNRITINLNCCIYLMDWSLLLIFVILIIVYTHKTITNI